MDTARLDPVAWAAALDGAQMHTAGVATRLAVARPWLGALEVPCPHPAQHGDRRQRREVRRHARSRQRIQEAVAVGTDLGDIGVALWPCLGQAHVLDPPAVALVPSRRRQGAQPAGRRRGDPVQRGAQRLGQQLDRFRSRTAASRRVLSVRC